MRKIQIVLFVALFAVVVILTSLLGLGYFKKENAGLVIYSEPQSTVFINGEQVGKTPYETRRKPDEILVKLLPDSFEKPLVPFETKINLTKGVKTVIQKDFAETEQKSSGVIASFEKIPSNQTEIAIVSVPDGAMVAIDSNNKGITPYKEGSISEGEHEIVLNAEGYKEKRIKVKAYQGYKVTTVFTLAPQDNVLAKEEIKEEAEEEPDKLEQVEILKTPTGFLRVRENASTGSKEIGRVLPGEKYDLLEEDADSDWYKIKIKEDLEGWVSKQYVKKTDSEESQNENESKNQ